MKNDTMFASLYDFEDAAVSVVVLQQKNVENKIYQYYKK